MIESLSAEEARVLGCLVEKEMTTPDYYPMTVNALVAACNQKTNREPVVTWDEEIVETALRSLNDRSLARFTRVSGSRALKYLHKADEVLQVDATQLALLAVMLLRGPQTPGELRSRTERYTEFADVADVERTLTDLITRDEPLVERLERVPGQKEHRFRTLLLPWDPSAAVPVPPAGARSAELADRLEALEARIARIESELGLDGD
jgi:uncharacterized protein YceH (UPF0502 family)